jgi:hypothetical protein
VLRCFALLLLLASACARSGAPHPEGTYLAAGGAENFHGWLFLNATGRFRMSLGCFAKGGRFSVAGNQVVLAFDSGKRRLLTLEPSGALSDGLDRFEPFRDP